MLSGMGKKALKELTENIEFPVDMLMEDGALFKPEYLTSTSIREDELIAEGFKDRPETVFKGEKGVLEACESIDERIVIPESFTSIGSNAFKKAKT